MEHVNNRTTKKCSEIRNTRNLIILYVLTQTEDININKRFKIFKYQTDSVSTILYIALKTASMS